MTTQFLIGDGAGNTTDLSSLYISKNKFLYGADPGVVVGSLYSAGVPNTYGQQGIGTTAPNNVAFTQAGIATNWSSVSSWYDNCIALAADGTMWTAGVSTATLPVIGDGAVTSRSVLTQIGTARKWANCIMGPAYALAVARDGTLWSWGYNGYGQLGLGDTAARSVPTQVGTSSDWAKVFVTSGNDGVFFAQPAPSAGSFAIKKDGTLWSWGGNSGGELGLGDTLPRSSPTQVGSLTDWKSVDGASSATLAVKIDGTLWGWGTNASNVLTTNSASSSPVQIGTTTTWATISCQSYTGNGTSWTTNCMATRTDGTLWGWGANQGFLGLGAATTVVSSPTQVGTLTTWKAVTIGGSGFPGMLALKTDGTIWGTSAMSLAGNPNSPVQIGTLNTWKSITAKTECVLQAIR